MLPTPIEETIVLEAEPAHQMRVLDGTGDTKLIWDVRNETEVDAARAMFDKLKSKHYTAYTVNKKGKPGKVLEKFDRFEEKIIMVPPMVGG